MGTYDALSVGEVFVSPSRVVSDGDLTTLVEVGGYTHPLFTDPAHAARTPFGRTPLPGEGILHLMGGLAEQTGRFDETVIALTGFDDVRFRAPAFAGDELRLEIEVLAKDPRDDGRGMLTMAWRCLNAAGDLLVEARARMLFRTA